MLYPTRRAGASLSALLAVLAAPALAQAPAIVSDIPVAHSLVSIVTEGLAEPVLLLDRGADAHDFSLRPSQARAVAGADLVVWMGPGMTPWMARAVESLGASATLELLEVEGLHLRPYGGHGHDDSAEVASHGHDDHDHDHDDHNGHDDHDDHAGHDDDHGHEDHDHDDHAHDDHEDHGHDDHSHDDHDHGHAHEHDHGDTDPHAWMDIDNARLWLDAIAEELSAIHPEGEARYRGNAEAGRARLDALEAELRATLAPVGNAGLAVQHDAYGYLAEGFGLNVLGSVAAGDATDPGAARLTALRATLSEAGAVCLFPEVNHSDAHIRLIAEGQDGLRVGAALDPEGVTLEPGPALYETLMRTLAQNIADCVTGD